MQRPSAGALAVTLLIVALRWTPSLKAVNGLPLPYELCSVCAHQPWSPGCECAAAANFTVLSMVLRKLGSSAP